MTVPEPTQHPPETLQQIFWYAQGMADCFGITVWVYRDHEDKIAVEMPEPRASQVKELLAQIPPRENGIRRF